MVEVSLFYYIISFLLWIWITQKMWDLKVYCIGIVSISFWIIKDLSDCSANQLLLQLVHAIIVVIKLSQTRNLSTISTTERMIKQNINWIFICKQYNFK